MKVSSASGVRVVVPASLEKTVVDFVSMLMSHPGFDINTHDIHFFVCPRRRPRPSGVGLAATARIADRK